MVIGRVELAIKAAKDVRDAASVTTDLTRVLVIKGPGRDPRANYVGRRHLQQQVARGRPVDAWGSAVAEYRSRKAFGGTHGIEDQPASPGRLVRSVEATLARQQEAAQASPGRRYVSWPDKYHA